MYFTIMRVYYYGSTLKKRANFALAPKYAKQKTDGIFQKTNLYNSNYKDD